MKIARLISLILIPFLFACPKKPEIPMTEVPAGPLLRALEDRNRAFSSLRAIAEIRVSRKDRKRSFDSVGILVNNRNQFRIEAYGPLGQTLVTLISNGKEVLLDLEGQRRLLEPGSWQLERVLGANLGPAELCAVLSGNIPLPASDSNSRLLCAADGRCLLEVRDGETLVRVRQDAAGESEESPIRSYEVYRADRPIYQVTFESFARISGYALPMKISVENRDRKMTLTVTYSEADVNVPLNVRAFVIPEAGE